MQALLPMIALLISPVFAAAGYSLIYVAHLSERFKIAFTLTLGNATMALKSTTEAS
jgi:hypothetical protein